MICDGPGSEIAWQHHPKSPDLWESESMNPYAADAGYMAGFAADAELHDRLSFIRRTYLHVFGAILAFISDRDGL